jgi:hypothetical protein
MESSLGCFFWEVKGEEVELSAKCRRVWLYCGKSLKEDEYER